MNGNRNYPIYKLWSLHETAYKLMWVKTYNRVEWGALRQVGRWRSLSGQSLGRSLSGRSLALSFGSVVGALRQDIDGQSGTGGARTQN